MEKGLGNSAEGQWREPLLPRLSLFLSLRFPLDFDFPFLLREVGLRSPLRLLSFLELYKSSNALVLCITRKAFWIFLEESVFRNLCETGLVQVPTLDLLDLGEVMD